MKLEDVNPEDVDEAIDWALYKATQCDVPLEDLEGANFLKVQGVFYIPVKMMEYQGEMCLFLGPLFPNPEVSGRKLGLALHRMIERLRQTFKGNIIYRNVEENGIDTLARFGGFEGQPGGMMVLRGNHV